MERLQEKYEEQILEMVENSNRLAELGYVSSHGGNLSYRVAEDVVLITPTKVAKRKIIFDDIVIINMDGEVLFADKGRRPTGEKPFHLRTLRKRDDINAVIHAHPPILTGFALLESDILARPLLPEPIIEVGPVLNVEYAEPLSEELARAFDRVLDKSNAFLMKNHGVLLCCREGIERALGLLDMLEQQAYSAWVAQTMGGVTTLQDSDVKDLENTIRTRGLTLPGASGAAEGLTDLY